MNTPAHVFIAAACFAKPQQPARNWALVIGALLPDLLMFWMVFWERQVNGLTEQQIFGEAYWYPHWQESFAVSNSIPLALLIMAIGSGLRREWVWVLGAAALLHMLGDLPLHNDDGHPHFWPFSNWIYASPVSYWDPDHHGVLAGAAEAAICTVLVVILWRRFRAWWVRLLLLAALAIELLFSVGGSLIYG